MLRLTTISSSLSTISKNRLKEMWSVPAIHLSCAFEQLIGTISKTDQNRIDSRHVEEDSSEILPEGKNVTPSQRLGLRNGAHSLLETSLADDDNV
ncbi:hypothetical protein ElyMa_006098800 [Elysia marginata]|uniref:Uncharacterized protein n=1 Tax=Elysia marginata TaxID=1093978 RepID=A0AAV4GRH2_9GAST|nr:hypothetical protein ElyMa_006098800 [Elysia marginata]